MLTQGSPADGNISAGTSPDSELGTRSPRFERDADLDFASEHPLAETTPAAALDLPGPAATAVALLCFLCLLAACTLVRPRLIRRIKGRRRRLPSLAPSSTDFRSLPAPAPAVAPVLAQRPG